MKIRMSTDVNVCFVWRQECLQHVCFSMKVRLLAVCLLLYNDKNVLTVRSTRGAWQTDSRYCITADEQNLWSQGAQADSGRLIGGTSSGAPVTCPVGRHSGWFIFILAKTFYASLWYTGAFVSVPWHYSWTCWVSAALAVSSCNFYVPDQNWFNISSHFPNSCPWVCVMCSLLWIHVIPIYLVSKHGA